MRLNQGIPIQPLQQAHCIFPSNTAYCKSKARGKTTATKIEAVQYLEKKSGSKWYVVTDGTWTDSVNDSLLIVSNNKSGLTSGTYRVRTVFTVYSGSDSEKVTAISKEVTI